MAIFCLRFPAVWPDDNGFQVSGFPGIMSKRHLAYHIESYGCHKKVCGGPVKHTAAGWTCLQTASRGKTVLSISVIRKFVEGQSKILQQVEHIYRLLLEVRLSYQTMSKDWLCLCGK